MFIAILSVKLKVKSYVQIHRMAMQYWDQIAAGLDLKRVSKRQLRNRLKKSTTTPEGQQRLSFSCFLNLSRDRVMSADNNDESRYGPAMA